MRLILSRKGFDSRYGGIPSPILPNGELLSLPIPSPSGNHAFRDIGKEGRALGRLLEQLPWKGDPDDRCHLDPDLDASSLQRPPGWRPMFGQVGAAQRHLENQGVTTGDLFLFFGWFRQTKDADRGMSFEPRSPNLHVVFGWLQIGSIVRDLPEFLSVNPWAEQHPHFHSDWRLNTVYVATEELSVAGLPRGLPGAGIFRAFRPKLQLTAPGRTRSLWKLPLALDPRGKRSALSYNRNVNRWEKQGDHVILDSAKIGQEFVLDLEDYPESIDWVSRMFSRD